jgi:hypothetical protein
VSEPADGDGTYDGGIDEDDRDHTEALLAAAILGLLALRTAKAPWRALVDSTLSGILTAYLTRAATSMATSAGVPGPTAAVIAGRAVDGVLDDVKAHTANWLGQSAQDRAPAGGGPMGRDQAEVASGMIARTLATYARERAREAVAEQLGAAYKTWMTREDSRVRPGHVFLQGKTKRIGKPFQTEGFEIMRPGDPDAPLHLTAGCRCHLVYSVVPPGKRR